jgi:hypothetical protein
MVTNTRTIKCGACGYPLPETMIASETAQSPCPKCGSAKQHVTLMLSDNVGLRMRDSLAGKVKDSTFPSKKKVRREFFYGSDERKSQGDYVYKEREIDRDANRYRELVKEETGEVIRDVDQRLTDHTGHGSAKFKTETSSQDEDADRST